MIIFLDFDGVLNSTSSMMFHNRKNSNFLGVANPNPISVFLIDELVKKTSANIVISSTWRIGKSVDDLKSILKNDFNFQSYDKVIDKTIYTGKSVIRGAEIKDWLDKNNTNHYMIIDDSSDFLKEQKKYHVKTNPDEGFSFADYQKSLKLLGFKSLFFV